MTHIRRDFHFHDLHSFVKMQFTLFTVLIHTVIIVDTVSYIRAFLYFSYENPLPNAVYCTHTRQSMTSISKSVGKQGKPLLPKSIRTN